MPANHRVHGGQGRLNDTRHDGHRFHVPPSRRLTSDLLTFSRQVPLCGHDRVMDLSDLAAVRAAAVPRISWVSVFLRAFGLVARDMPELRQTWYRWPWAHLYQHPVSIASVTVHRRWRHADWLFWGQIHQPENSTLPDIQKQVELFRDGPPGRVFRRQIQLARLPVGLRRLIWWWNVHVATAGRARRLGTCFLSTLAGRGAEIQVPPSIHTGCLTFGPLDDRGRCRVTLAYDHRVMDGVCAATALARLEATLCRTIRDELNRLSTASGGQQAA